MSDIEEFNKLLSNCIFDDGGLDCTMKDGYFVFDMVHICDYHGVVTENIFPDKEV